MSIETSFLCIITPLKMQLELSEIVQINAEHLTHIIILKMYQESILY